MTVQTENMLESGESISSRHADVPLEIQWLVQFLTDHALNKVTNVRYISVNQLNPDFRYFASC